MADQKITALTAITTLTNDDLIPVVNDPAGTPVTNSITVGSVKTVLTPVDGWIPVTDTWTYASASTITVPTDGTTVYQKGIKIRLKQGGGYKYYVGTTVAATLITVLVNTDYTVANAAITDVSYSYIENPLGWPSAFNVTITTEGLTTPSYNSQAGRIQVLGRMLKFDGRVDINSWAGQTGYIKIVIPFAVTHVAGTGRGVGSYYRTGTSTQQGTHQLSTLTSTTFGLVNNAADDTIAWEASARVVFQFQFLCDF